MRKTLTIGAALCVVALCGCDPDIEPAEELGGVVGEDVEETAMSGLGLGADVGPAPTSVDPSDVLATHDTFAADLDHVWVGSVGESSAVIGYDTRGQEIGRITLHPHSSTSVRLIHEYPAPCRSGETSTHPGRAACADVWDVVWDWGGGSQRAWLVETTRTAPVPVFADRQAALMGAIKGLDPKGSPILCAAGVLVTAAACFGSGTLWLVPACAGSSIGTVCACREVLEEWDSDIKLGPVCGKK